MQKPSERLIPLVTKIMPSPPTAAIGECIKQLINILDEQQQLMIEMAFEIQALKDNKTN